MHRLSGAATWCSDCALLSEEAKVSAKRTSSELFRHIEDLQGGQPWGSFLDAGTGTHSMGWIASLETERWTAISGAEGHAIQVRDAVENVRRPQDRIIVANWASERLLHGETYDTVLADYLLGAIEGFAPYFQDRLFARLRPHVGQRLYVVGVEPYVIGQPTDAAGAAIWQIGRFRDACLLLAGEQPYREFPMGWATHSLRTSGYRVLSTRRFAIRYKARFVNSQIDMALMRLETLADPSLAAALTARGEVIRANALRMAAAEGGIRHGSDYVIAAEPA
jgi:hypothetical protein